jgi:hypothetical protein
LKETSNANCNCYSRLNFPRRHSCSGRIGEVVCSRAPCERNSWSLALRPRPRKKAPAHAKRSNGCTGPSKALNELATKGARHVRFVPKADIRLSYSITSSARASNCGDTDSFNIRAVSALMTSSSFVDCTIGRSAGFAPLRMRVHPMSALPPKADIAGPL